MRIRVGARSDIGRARQRNEDSYLVNAPLFAVADGMGGHRGGNVASALALETLDERETPGRDFPELVLEIKEANRRVMERGEADRDLRGMGTTLTAILADGAKAYVAHVGDSRAYLLRDGALQQLTEDHTLVQRMVREGRLSEEEAATHPQRSVVTRALGIETDVPVDELTLDLMPGDRLLLCTDGLTNMVGRERIREILATEEDPQVASDHLIDAANRAGGDDNITVVLLDVLEDDGAADPGPVAAVHGGAGALDGSGARTAPSSGRARTLTGEREEGADATGVVPRIQGSGRRVRRRRVAAWAAVAVALIVGAVVGTKAYVDHQWYVGDANGRVAIYNGIPTKVLGVRLSHVRETTELAAADAERLQPWSELEQGITAESLQDAQDIVGQIRQDLQAPVGG